MSCFECFSLTVSTIYCFNPKLRLCFVRNWVLQYINENANPCAQLSRSPHYQYYDTIDSLVKVSWISIHQTLFRLEGRLEGFEVSSWFLKIMKLVEYRIAKKCHYFRHCCRWLFHHHSGGCQVRFYLMKQSLTLTTWFEKCCKLLIL